MKRSRTDENPVKFSLACLAKEKGYYPKIQFMANYYNWKGDLNGDSTDQIKEFLHIKKSGETGPLQYDNVYAPTCSYLQSWLRDVKGIVVWVDVIQVNVAEQIGIRYTWNICDLQGNILSEDESPLGFLEWGDALETGLEKCLNLV